LNAFGHHVIDTEIDPHYKEPQQHGRKHG
jgi:hypothetical protein